MADFISFVADASDDSNDDEVEMLGDDNLIDDTAQENNELSFFSFHNQARDIPEIEEDIKREAQISIDHLEANNYLEQSEIDNIGNESLDEFAGFEKSKNEFFKSLKTPVENQTRENSFYLTLLHAIRFLKNKKSDQCDEIVIEKEIGSKLYLKIAGKKDKCILDLNKAHFDEMCYEINKILIDEKLFLRVYEIKDKFRYLFHEDRNKKNFLTLSSCIKEKFNGFTFAEIWLQTKQKSDLFPVNILYMPVKKENDIIEYFFTNDLKNAYRALYMKGTQQLSAKTLYECFYCNDFWLGKDRYEGHLRFCRKKPGVVYNFNLKNIVTFEENLKYKGDVSFSVYADFETSAPTSDYLSSENRQMFAVSYYLIFAWHPKLSLPRQAVIRGCNHSLDELLDMTYLTSEQLAMKNKKTLRQLRDVIADVHNRKRKNSIVERFNIELKFSCDILMTWFKNKIKKITLDNEILINYKRLFPITSETSCVICDFPLDVDPKG